jgi:AcrR family transcriptional regulator
LCKAGAVQDTAPATRDVPAAPPDAAGLRRRRLLDGMSAALREKPYAEVTVSDVVRHARTSRRTFYEHFASKQDCLIAVFKDSNERVIDRIAEAVDPHAPWATQIRQAIETWLTGVDEDREVTLSWIRVIPSLGDEARSLLRETMAAFAELIHRLSDTPELAAAGISPPSAEESVILLGGLRELIATTVEDGGDVREVVDVATRVTTRVLGPRAD